MSETICFARALLTCDSPALYAWKLSYKNCRGVEPWIRDPGCCLEPNSELQRTPPRHIGKPLAEPYILHPCLHASAHTHTNN